MNNLKLIAIRPNKKCDKKYLKVLTAETPYIFYNEFDFSEYNDKDKIVRKLENHTANLYLISDAAGKEISINISAVVGENGSGKSSLAELFYVACYNISVLQKVLFDEESEKLIPIKKRVENIHVDIFYEFDDNIFLLKLADKEIKLYKHVEYRFVACEDEKFSLDSFFYTISINYSLHSLNSEVLGLWVKKIFHKNDGYQTPIVLNPYRNKGNIEINNEEYLIKSRLLSNILGKLNRKTKPENSLRNVINEKIAYKLHITLNKEKFTVDDKDETTFKYTNEYGHIILPIVYKYFLKNEKFVPEDTLLNRYAKEYIISKLFNIATKYEPYKSSYQSFYNTKSLAEKYISLLAKHQSHITFKLIQAINFLDNELYFRRPESFNLTVSYLADKLEQESLSTKKELIDILPPAFFDVDIEFKDADRFNQLSSGEKQRVYSIATLIYHLNNLNSVSKDVIKYKYRRINIIFDEVELYFHPEFQRTLINDLLENIKKATLEDIDAINMLFITHSPFILSDIACINTLVLQKNGTPLENGLNLQTFGSNIFDLLKHSFFLENGPMGEFAKSKINQTILWLNNSNRNLEEKSQHRLLISMIGEPILQMKLSEMFDVVTNEKTEEKIIEQRIAELQKLLKKKSE